MTYEQFEKLWETHIKNPPKPLNEQRIKGSPFFSEFSESSPEVIEALIEYGQGNTEKLQKIIEKWDK